MLLHSTEERDADNISFDTEMSTAVNTTTVR